MKIGFFRADQEDAGAAGKSAEIADVRKMGNEQRVEAMVSELGAELALTAKMVHSRDCSNGSIGSRVNLRNDAENSRISPHILRR